MKFRISLLVSLIFCLQLLAEVPASQPKIEVVVFDFGGVIGTTDKASVRSFISESLGLSKWEEGAVFRDLRSARKRGVSENAFFVDLAKAHGHPDPEAWTAELHLRMVDAVHTIPGMLELVEDLKRAGYQTAMLSNISKREAALIREKGIYAYFHPVILSCDIEASKPKPEAYRALLNQLNVPATHVVFIDDKSENIAAAKKFKIQGIKFTSLKQLKAQLKDLGLVFPMNQAA